MSVSSGQVQNLDSEFAAAYPRGKGEAKQTAPGRRYKGCGIGPPQRVRFCPTPLTCTLFPSRNLMPFFFSLFRSPAAQPSWRRSHPVYTIVAQDGKTKTLVSMRFGLASSEESACDSGHF